MLHVQWIREPGLRGGFRIASVQSGQRRIAAFEKIEIVHAVFGGHRGLKIGAFEQPARIAAVAPLIQDERARTGDEFQILGGKQRQQAAQIPPRI